MDRAAHRCHRSRLVRGDTLRGIAGIPNLELAGLCTRRPERLAEQARKFGVNKDLLPTTRHACGQGPSMLLSIVTM